MGACEHVASVCHIIMTVYNALMWGTCQDAHVEILFFLGLVLRLLAFGLPAAQLGFAMAFNWHTWGGWSGYDCDEPLPRFLLLSVCVSGGYAVLTMIIFCFLALPWTPVKKWARQDEGWKALVKRSGDTFFLLTTLTVVGLDCLGCYWLYRSKICNSNLLASSKNYVMFFTALVSLLAVLGLLVVLVALCVGVAVCTQRLKEWNMARKERKEEEVPLGATQPGYHPPNTEVDATQSINSS